MAFDACAKILLPLVSWRKDECGVREHQATISRPDVEAIAFHVLPRRMTNDLKLTVYEVLQVAYLITKQLPHEDERYSKAVVVRQQCAD